MREEAVSVEVTNRPKSIKQGDAPPVRHSASEAALPEHTTVTQVVDASTNRAGPDSEELITIRHHVRRGA
jgi:hypothetical protein